MMVDVGHPVLDALASIGGVLDAALKATDESRGEFTHGELTEAVLTHHELRAQLDALGLDLISEAAATDVASRSGAASTEEWLGALTKQSAHTARNLTHTASVLDTFCPDTKAALETGRIGYEQTSAIAEIISDLPQGASSAQIAEVEQYLLDRAPTSTRRQLRGLQKRVADLIDPEGLLERKNAAQKKPDLTIRDNRDGTRTVRWTDTAERIATLKAAIDPLAAPRPAIATAADTADTAAADTAKDERALGQRRADAMADLIERALRFRDRPSTPDRRPYPTPRRPRPTVRPIPRPIARPGRPGRRMRRTRALATTRVHAITRSGPRPSPGPLPQKLPAGHRARQPREPGPAARPPP